MVVHSIKPALSFILVIFCVNLHGLASPMHENTAVGVCGQGLDAETFAGWSDGIAGVWDNLLQKARGAQEEVKDGDSGHTAGASGASPTKEIEIVQALSDPLPPHEQGLRLEHHEAAPTMKPPVPVPDAMRSTNRNSRSYSQKLYDFRKSLSNPLRNGKLFIVGSNPGDLMNIPTFKNEFKIASVDGKSKLLLETFDSLIEKRVLRSTKELLEWSQLVREIMQLEDRFRIQDMKLEGIVLVELSKLLIKASKDKKNSPRRQSLQEFTSLYRELYMRLENNRPLWIEDTGYLQVPLAMELLNVDEDIFEYPEKVKAMEEVLSNDAFIGPAFNKVKEYAQSSTHENDLLREILWIFEVMMDETLSLQSYQVRMIPKKKVNVATLEQRTAACRALWYIHRSIKTGKGIIFTTWASQHFVSRLVEQYFGLETLGMDFLYPHYRRLLHSYMTPRKPPQLLD
ncbi:hypothetical protein O181_082099 [Austropuccinia psidii MF-1]|uniref:Uncharacterized protein n=1 Tax=Austropuccinia psidii MF-1 TaxID=1389203 RepID=A0A9Q3FNL2_9BASI|nr:hypothetical protein [Austropuccinia psidii MF-1]